MFQHNIEKNINKNEKLETVDKNLLKAFGDYFYSKLNILLEATDKENKYLLEKLENLLLDLDNLQNEKDLQTFFNEYKKIYYSLNLGEEFALLDNNYLDFKQKLLEEYLTTNKKVKASFNLEKKQNLQYEELIAQIKADKNLAEKIENLEKFLNVSLDKLRVNDSENKNFEKTNDKEKNTYQLYQSKIIELEKKIDHLLKRLIKLKQENEAKSFLSLFNAKRVEEEKELELKLDKWESYLNFYKIKNFLKEKKDLLEQKLENNDLYKKKGVYLNRLWSKNLEFNGKKAVYKNYAFLGNYLHEHFHLDNLMIYWLLGSNLSLEAKHFVSYSKLNEIWNDLEGFQFKNKSFSNILDLYKNFQKNLAFLDLNESKNLHLLFRYLTYKELEALLKGGKELDLSYYKNLDKFIELLDDEIAEEKKKLNEIDDFIEESKTENEKKILKLIQKRNLQNQENALLLSLNYLAQKSSFTEYLNQKIQNLHQVYKKEEVNNLRDKKVKNEFLEKFYKAERIPLSNNFLDKYPLLEKYNIEKKGEYYFFEISAINDFKIVDQALRVIILQFLDNKFIYDNDGFSRLDALRLELLIQKFKDELKDENSELNSYLYFDSKYLIIRNFQYLENYINQKFTNLVKEVKSLDHPLARDWHYQNKTKYIDLLNIKLIK